MLVAEPLELEPSDVELELELEPDPEPVSSWADTEVPPVEGSPTPSCWLSSSAVVSVPAASSTASVPID